MKIHLIRHAESEGNVQHIMQGHADYSLSNRGRLQASIMGDYLNQKFCDNPPDHLYISPLKRTLETANEITRQMSLNITFLDDLKEVDSGIFSGLNWKEAGEKYPKERADFKAARDWGVIPGGESKVQLWKRIQGVLDLFIKNHSEESNIWVVTHGGVIRAFLSLIAGIAPQENIFICIDNTSMSLVGIKGQRRFIQYINQTKHLTEDQFESEGAPM